MVHRFSLLDTGNNMVSVKAVDQRGKTTGTVSFAIIVKAYRPSISSQEEVVASVGDSLAFRANAYDSNGTIVAYFWAIDGNDFSLVTPTGLLSWPWGFYQAGTHVVNVKALDDDSLFSPVVTTRVIVAPNAPQVHWLIPDTAISINDTLMLRAIAIDEGALSPGTSGRLTELIFVIRPLRVSGLRLEKTGRRQAYHPRQSDQRPWSRIFRRFRACDRRPRCSGSDLYEGHHAIHQRHARITCARDR